MFNRYRTMVIVGGLVWSCSLSWALPDPTRPASYQTEAVQHTLKLESVLISEARKVAVINGHVVAEGDRIGSTRVISIHKDRVQVSRGGVSSTLAIKHTSIRQEK